MVTWESFAATEDKAMNAKHSSASSTWYTPVDIIERARRVLGAIDFDPASDSFGNSRVRADVYATQVDDSSTSRGRGPSASS